MKQPKNKDYIYLCDWFDVDAGKRVTCYAHPYIMHTSDLYEMVLDTIYEAARVYTITDIQFTLQKYDPYVSDEEEEAAREAFYNDDRYHKEFIFEDEEAAI